MINSRRSAVQPQRLAATFVIVAVLILSGCGSDRPDTLPQDTTAVANAHSAKAMARQFLRYSYEGAILSSTHPLSDSVARLIKHPAPGEFVTLVDTFSVDAATTRNDSVTAVSVTFPRALEVSLDWRTADAEIRAERALRVGPNGIQEAPRIVGWPALQAHINDVVADSGATVANRIKQRFRELGKEVGV